MVTRLIGACALVLLAGCATGTGTARSAASSAPAAGTATAAPAKAAAKQPICEYEETVGSHFKARTCRTPDDGAEGRAAAQDLVNQMQTRGAQQGGARPGGG